MNTEATQDKTATNSPGERLRQARESRGFTQQNVAERLCLKLSTVRDIEEDKNPTGLASTFLRGYIRSYARLVNIPEDELLPAVAKQQPVHTSKVKATKSAPFRKRNKKKRDGWLMMITWLILFIVVGLTGAWWWQERQIASNELSTVNEPAQGVDRADQTDPISDESMDSEQPQNEQVASEDNIISGNNSASEATVAPAIASAVTIQPQQTTLPIPKQPTQPAPVPEAPNSTESDTTSADPNAVIMNFNAECWLEVTDSTGKKLFSGLQQSGGKLSLAGTAPYKLKIGAPAAVDIQYNGQAVDLSKFIRSNQVARLTLGQE